MTSWFTSAIEMCNLGIKRLLLRLSYMQFKTFHMFLSLRTEQLASDDSNTVSAG